MVVAVTAVLIGVKIGYRELDVDEAVYRETLVRMQSGQGYYPAMSGALVGKEGSPPRSIRAVRLPTLYVALRWIPPGAWRYVVGIAYLATLLIAFRLGSPYGRFGGPVAAVLAGLWVIAGARLLFLHAEVWAIPFLLGGALVLRGGRDRSAAALIAFATIIRELCGLGLIIGLFLRKRKSPWALALAGVGMFALIHVGLAGAVLSPTGYEAPLGNERLDLAFMLDALSPGEGAAAWIAGIPILAAGLVGLGRVRSSDASATFLLPFVVIMAIATVGATRVYWAMLFGPGLAAFVPAAVAARRNAPAGPGAPPSSPQSRF